MAVNLRVIGQPSIENRIGAKTWIVQCAVGFPIPLFMLVTLRDIAAQIESRLFLAHVRPSDRNGGAADELTPMEGRWLFVHNGFLTKCEHLRHDLILPVGPQLFENVDGTTDLELLLHLALKFGLEENAIGALERTVALSRNSGAAAAWTSHCR